jgi:PncC family amidohydrolase
MIKETEAGRIETELPELAKKLRALGWTLATAESCTGGLLSGAITELAGSSDYYLGGVVAYSNEVKHRVLGVSQTLLIDYGAVSQQVAEAMAKGVSRLTGCDLAISTTGIAGPASDGTDKPVGLVYIGISGPAGLRVARYQFSGERYAIRRSTVSEALRQASDYIDHIPDAIREGRVAP